MIGSRLQERYELSAELGRGGMGVVFEAWDPRLNRQVAIKVILPEHLDDEIEARFRREARVVARMDHPGIVPIFDYGRHEGSLFFVMPRLRGATLRELLGGRSLDVDEILRIAAEIAEALDYSSMHGVVHRDIKPGNIMVSREDEQLRVRVMDFGLARPSMEPSMSGSVTVIGTPLYLSPEQVIGEKVDGRSDLYSLGALLYECLSGEPPFTGDMYSVIYRIVNEQPQSLRSRGVDVDETLDGIVLSCLAKDPLTRPQRGRDLAEALSRHLSGLRESAPAAVLMARPKRVAAQMVLPLVGRDAELAELRRRLEMALTHECQWALVGGEAGIGKTRLLQELENQARVSQIRVLRSRFTDRESALPYHGFCELIHDYFRAHKVGHSAYAARHSADGVAEKAGRRADISELATDLITLFPALAEIRELREAQRSPDSKLATWAQPPSGHHQPSFLFEVLARTLAWMADGRAMVLLLENLHEAEASLEALRYVFYRLGPSPILIVGTYRDTDLARNHPLAQMLRGLSDDPRVCSLVLKRLDREAFLDLVTFQIEGAPLDPQFVDELLETAEGNPYFAIELLRSYLETGNLQCGEDGVFRLSQAAATQVLPKTIRETVEGRIERLDASLQQLLSIASVLGRSFEYRDLEAVLEDGPSDLDEALDFLVAQGLLEEGRRTRGDWLIFSSAVVREALYRNLSRRRRNSLHRRHAQALEKRHTGRLERIYPRLVHHFSVGGMAEKTTEYAIALARQSLAAWSSTDAIQAIRTALELVDEVQDPLGREGELRELLARAHGIAGDADASLAEAARAVDVYERAKLPEEKVRMVQLAAQTAWQLRRVDDVEAWVNRGLALARGAGSLEGLERLLTLGATVANLRGAYRVARRYLEEAQQLSLGSGTFAGVAGLNLAIEELIPSGGNLVAALRQPVLNLAPGALKTFEEHEISANVYETLVSVDQEGNLVPWLCQDWQGSVDMSRFELTLRPGVRFTDGGRLTASVVKASLERSARRKHYSPPMGLAVLAGLGEFIAAQADHIEGIEVLETGRQERLGFQLTESLPIFPATLTDQKIAISRFLGEAETGAEIGTGPFCIVRREPGLDGPGRVVLESHPGYWRGVTANLDRIEFLTSLETSEITAGLRAGQVDLAWDLLPDDLEDLLRDPRYQAGWSEVKAKNVYFALFNLHGPVFRLPAAREDGGLALRRALFESIRIHDLVWRSLGRLAQPALSLIPPGVFGHNPGRRKYPLAHERAEELLRGAGWREPLSLRTVVHPAFHDRFEPFLVAFQESLARLGVRLQIETRTLKQYISRWSHNDDIDLFLGRWNGDYDDPDSYTYALFHSAHGLLRRYYHSEDTDLLMDLARHEYQAANRQTLYWNLEAVLDEQHAVLPLFHDVDYRIAGPRVRGFRLSHVLPYVNYSELGKAKEVHAAAARRPNWQQAGGEIHVPIPSRLDALDPLTAGYADHLEVTSNVFETLTRIVDGARVVAWLASSFETLAGGRSYRFQLRPDVRFHDGRRLTARDVRYTYERVLRMSGDDMAHNMAHLLLPIRGARALREGQASGLAGFRIVSAEEIVIELENPLELFPALLAQSSLAIVQEGQAPVGTSWRDGLVGTGPFRVVRFVPGERVELERNPDFRRPDIPRSERLVFHLDVASDEAVEGLRRGRFSLASRLRMADVEALRQDPEWARGAFEAPGLSTWFLALNSSRGVLADPVLRRALVSFLDVEDCVEQALGRQGFVAQGLFPPGLLGSLQPREGAVPEVDSDSRSSDASRGILAGHQDWRLRAAVHVAFSAQYAAFWQQLRRRFHALGITLDVTWGDKPETTEKALGDQVSSFDLAIDHWYAYYPDVDSFAMGLLHSQEGHHGSFIASAEIDQLSEEGRWQADPAERHVLYRRIESILARQALLVPLFYEQTYHFKHPRVKGFRSGFSFPMVRYDRLTAMP